MYWSCYRPGHQTTRDFQRHMLCSYFYDQWVPVTPQRNSDFYDPAAWLKPIMQHTNNVFKRYISPNRELSVDEALVGTKARSVMTQYIPTKINQVKKTVNQLKSVSGKHLAKPWSVRTSKSLLPLVLYAWLTNQTHVEYYS
jgi:hypothetical protein